MFSLAICVASVIQVAFGLNGRGLTPLDSASFDKITSKFKATLIKFDKYFPYGPDHDEYVKMAVNAADNSDFLVAEVGVKDYGDYENKDLLERFGISPEDLPVIKLYFPDGRPPLPFSGVPLPLPGALAEFDALAGRLAAAEPAERAPLLAEADRLLREAPAERRDTAQYYVRVMGRLAEEGSAVVETERRRVRGLLEGKLSEQKRREMETRLNVLQAFVAPADGAKDEL
ncbi:endoplasmic reticulum resident protein 29-like [Pollicipes pollicipes]|uniref:endoplasmic reticulum resident protein 29-like n=1 Tax=Pollicipes pollicipes TaxID=41117 RepID=UPI00188549E0|nr:endoplasmic reticulum resident protein 29-like [Pollicipes pollicipes]